MIRSRLRSHRSALFCIQSSLLAASLLPATAYAQVSMPQEASFPLPGTAVTAPVPQLPPDGRAERLIQGLIGRMTPEEKILQMSQVPLNQPSGPTDELARQGLGSFLFVTDPVRIDHLQHIAVEQSRLHIPLIFGFDVIHGFRTVFPVPIAMAASWDPQVAVTAQHIAATEARSQGVDWTFAPMVDIARDPRWGRMMEGAGEDPYLGSRMAEAQVHGFQGTSLSSPDSILACVKHFAGYGAALGGRDYDEANISDEQLWNVYLPPFHAALAAGAGSLMSAYMDLNGVPATGNRWLLHDVLRQDWKFQGFVVSDWESVKNLTTHGFSADDADAAARAADAGVDMEMTSDTFRNHLAEDVKSGRVPESVVDQAVHDILLAKYRLGLFDHPYVDVAAAPTKLVTPANRAAAREAATRVAVLLRNQGGLLPLAPTVKKIALIGPLANTKIDVEGSWSLASKSFDSVTVLAGIEARFPGAQVQYTTGVEIERKQPSIFDGQFPSDKPKMTTDAERDAEFHHALDLIGQSDVAVLALGELQSMSGEFASRASLTLPGEQEKLLEAAVATGKPVVLLLFNARPLDISWASTHVPAILDVWYGGTEAGNAVADLLSGAASPGGKLPFQWPRDVGQVPIPYATYVPQNPDNVAGRYWDEPSTPLYPFGFGLNYSTTTVDNLRVGAPTVQAGSKVRVTVDVHNTGSRSADEVVQLYTHQRSGSASRPVRELKGFRRVTVAAGQTETVTLELDSDELGFWSPATHQWAIEPGTFDLWAGSSSRAENHATFIVTR